MSAWNDLVGRLTRRLAVDEELRLDVARELRCHLEDSTAEFRAAGQDDKQAAASAIKALGDEKELAEQLWQANRRRIRLRGVLRWTARATLAPLAVVVVLVFLVSSAGIVMIYQSLGEIGGGKIIGWPLAGLGRLVCDPYAGIHLTEEQRFLLEGDPNAKTELERAKSISDRWPDNPIYYGNYIAYLLNQQKPIQDKPGEKPLVDEEKLAEVIAALRHGEQVDPNNAFYNLEIASLLVRASTILRDDPSTTFDAIGRDGKITPSTVDKIEILDAKRFDQSLEEFRRGLAKPLLTSYGMEMLRLRLNMLPAPFRMVQYLNRLLMAYNTLLPGLQDDRTLAKSLLAYARQLAARGQADQALQSPQDVKRLAGKLGTQSDFLIDLLVARALDNLALGYQEVLDKALGRSEAAQAARRQRMEDYEFFNRIWAGRNEHEAGIAHVGLLESIILPTLPGYKADLKPLRIAELFVAVQVGLLGLLAGLIVVAAVLGLVTVCQFIFLPKVDRPVLLFVGWQRMGKICLLAVVAPLAIYAAYSFLAAAFGSDVGLTWLNSGRLIVELTAMACLVLALVVLMACSAVRQRGLELGLAVPPPLTWRKRPVMLGLTALVVLAAGAYVVAWWVGFRGIFDRRLDLLLATVIVGLMVLWGLRELIAGFWQDRTYLRFQRSLRRSLIPILAAAVIVVGIGLGGLLATGEGFAVSRMGKGLPMPDEIKNSDFRLLQERFVEQEKSPQEQVSRPGPG